VLAGRHTFSKEVDLIDAHTVDCRVHDGSRKTIYVEADGEVLGVLPARMEIARDTLHLLVPPGARP